jgi:hypothetical protein
VGSVLSNDAAKVAAVIPKLGAEYLPGKGSFLLVEGGRILRLQGYYLTAEEVTAVVGALRQCYGVDNVEKVAGGMITQRLDHYQRLKRLGMQAEKAYAPDVLAYAKRQGVIDLFHRYYDRESGEMRYGWQAAMVRMLFGQHANRGGWNRQKSLEVVAYLRSNLPALAPSETPLVQAEYSRSSG